MDLIVVFDREKEIAVAVDTENRVGFGPGMIGPDAGEVLEAFYASIPYDLEEASSYMVRGWFETFAETYPFPQAPTTAAATENTVAADDPAGSDGGAALANATAAAATDVPGEQPADTDPEASPPPVTETVTCWNCNGRGTIATDDKGGTIVCGICAGKGTLQQQAEQ
jgi:hypothetical protein